MSEGNPRDPGRRDFFLRGFRAAAAVAALGAGAWSLRGRQVRQRLTVSETPVSLPDFSVRDTSGCMVVARGSERARTLERALDAAGGMERFIKQGDRVLVKVNAAFASPPTLGATTHPHLLSAIVRKCIEAGAAEVFVTDNPVHNVERSFEQTGLAEAALTSGAKLILPQSDSYRPAALVGGRLLSGWPILFEPLKNVNKLIGVAPLKTHACSGATMTMKNWFGLLGGKRSLLHQDIHNAIKEAAMLVKPTLVVLDATTAMMTNGPTGGSLSDLRTLNTIVLGVDQVAVDACGASLLGMRVTDLPFITKAAAAGVGTANYDLLNPIKVQVQ